MPIEFIIEVDTPSSVTRIQNVDVVILCGGQGTRFLSVRKDIPKALAPINGIPIIELIVDGLKKQGLRRFIFAVGYLKEHIVRYFKDREDADYKFSIEDRPMGTGGAIRQSLNLVCSDPFLVFNGDSLIDVDICLLLEKHRQVGAEASLVLSSTTFGAEYGGALVNEKGLITSYSEKPVDETTNRLTNAGVYCISHNLMNGLSVEENLSFEKTVLPDWIRNHNIFGFQVQSPVYDIGTSEGYLKLNEKMEHAGANLIKG